MGLVIYDWYDLMCLGIVGAALLGSLYAIWMRESRGGGKCDATRSMNYCESLLVGGGGGVESGGQGHVIRYWQLWGSCWIGLHPAWLLGIRLFCFITLCAFLAWDLVEWGASIFFYYTEWTFTLVIIYFAISTIVSAHGCVLYYFSSKKAPAAEVDLLEEARDENNNEFMKVDVEQRNGGCCVKQQTQRAKHAIQERAGFLGYIMQILFQTCAGATILTDILFWCVIVPFLSNAHLQVNLLMGAMHTLNAFSLLIETSVNSLPFPWFRLAYFVNWSCFYVTFQLVIHACGYTWWPYPFLELSTPWAPFWYLCLAVIHLPCYGIYSLIVKAKNSIFSRLFPHSFVEF